MRLYASSTFKCVIQALVSETVQHACQIAFSCTKYCIFSRHIHSNHIYVHIATFGQVVLDETMFYLKRTVVDYTSIIDTYRVVQMKYKYSVSYSTRIIVSIMYTEE